MDDCGYQLSSPQVSSFQMCVLYCHSEKQRRCVMRLAGRLAAAIPTQRSPEIKGTDEEEKMRRKGLVSHAGGCQGCLPNRSHISSLSRIRNEQKFNSVQSWYQVATLTIQTGPALLCLPLSSYGISLLLLLGLKERLCKSNVDKVESQYLSLNTKPFSRCLKARVQKV